jgi:hypothetical protein
MLLAVSTLGAIGLSLVAVAGLVAAGWALAPFGRAAERFTDQGHTVSTDRPEFRRPPDEGGLL